MFSANESGGDVVEAFYREVIPRLLTEIDGEHSLSRMVGFRAAMDEDKLWQFIGVEVRSFDGMPSGMMGISLGSAVGELVGQGGVRERFPLKWLWRDRPGMGSIGEFEAVLPLLGPACRSFGMTTHAFIGAPGAISEEDSIELVDYDNSWPDQFENMAVWLREVMGGVATCVAHYGSTSVPGISAKPVIDILVEVTSFDEARRCMIPALKGDSWEYWWYGDHMIFIKRARRNGPRTHHVHVAPPGHRLWEGLAFRDYLLAHPETAREYSVLKQELAVRFRLNREQYTNAKTTFIRSVTDRALLQEK